MIWDDFGDGGKNHDEPSSDFLNIKKTYHDFFLRPQNHGRRR